MNLTDYLQSARDVVANPNPSGNAVLTFEIATGIEIVIDEYGNSSPVTTTQQVSLTAWLKQSKPPDNQVQDGLNQNREYFEGELVNPKTYELPLRPENDISVVINNRDGKFYPVELFDSPASLQYSINLWMGQKIAGWVEFAEGN